MSDALDEVLARGATFSAFLDHQRHLCTANDLEVVVQAAREALERGEAQAVTVFHDATGNRTEVEPGAQAVAVRGRLVPGTEVEKREGPGRPKLGVVSREVSLLPRHWEWLNAQSGGASAAIRRLVDQARKEHRARDAARGARDAAYRSMSVLVGDQPGFEEASRALYADQLERFQELSAPWPADLREHLLRMAGISAALADLAAREAVRPTS